MNDTVKRQALNEAGCYLTKAIQALEDAGYRDIVWHALTTKNEVLKEIRVLNGRRAAITIVPDAELRTRSLTVEVR